MDINRMTMEKNNTVRLIFPQWQGADIARLPLMH